MTYMDGPVSWGDMNRIVAALSARLSAIESLFGVGPHTLVAKDGRMALCGGPGHCQACDCPTKIWPYNRRQARLIHAKPARSHFIPDYDSEGSY